MAWDKHLPGDVARVLRESLDVVTGEVALLSYTLPGRVEVCPCCGERVPDRFRVLSPADMTVANREFHRRLRRLDGRIRVEMWREGLRPPRVVAWVKQLQERGALHKHGAALCRTPDERTRVARYVALWRRWHVGYGLGFIDDPFRLREGGRDMVFRRAGVLGHYLGKYMGGGQLERAIRHEDRGGWGHLWWVSPVLIARSGWTLTRCRWVRQGYRILAGQWTARTWYGGVSLPSWWHVGAHRSWVLAVLGSPGADVPAGALA
jgi:hypothetical protein